MISNNNYTQICTDVTKVENYEEALNDPEEKYVLHHVLEWKYSSAELKSMNMYYHRPPGEFLFVTEDVHNNSRLIHIGNRASEKWKALFKEQTGLHYNENEFYYRNWKKRMIAKCRKK